LKQKLVVLGVLVAFAALFAARVPSAHADPFNSNLTVTLVPCSGGDPSCGTPDASVQAGESVGTILHTALMNNPVIPGGGGTSSGSFYDAIRTVITGIAPAPVAPPAGDTVGHGTFTINLAVGVRCGDPGTVAITPLGGYTIYATNDANNFTHYSGTAAQYAKGLGFGWTWAQAAADGWIQDFDDDNNNNVPDNTEAFAGDSLAQTVQDLAVPNGKPDGADREPLFVPLLDTIMGSTHSSRNFANAVVSAGAIEVGVDFMTYKDYPSVGKNTQLAVIQEGSGLGLLPSSNATANQQTCPPFESDIETFNKSSSGALVQTAASSPISYDLQASTGDDFDGDGIADYYDNCDLVPNNPNLDGDGDGIGDACDPAPAVAAVADVDADGWPNYADSCPFAKNSIDNDADGVDNICDPAPSIVGDGRGYAAPAPGYYLDHDFTDTLSITLPDGGGLHTGATTTYQDSNDNFVPDATDDGSVGTIGSGIAVGDSDGDGVTDKDEITAGTDPLNPGGRIGKCGTDCDFDPLFPNVYGDGCKDSEESGKNIGGTPLSGTNPWDFYGVPSTALFKAPNPLTVFRASGSLSGAGAQAIFAYYKAGGNLGTVLYDQDLNQNNVMDGVEYDRKVSGGGPTLGPDGVIGAGEAQKAFAEFKAGLSCSSGYRLNDHTWYNGGAALPN